MYVNLGVCVSKLQKHMFPANGIGGGEKFWFWLWKFALSQIMWNGQVLQVKNDLRLAISYS